MVDTFDAIMSDRPYRRGATLSVALRELTENKGTQFDPDLVVAFLEVLRSGRVDLAQLYGPVEDLNRCDELEISEKVLA